MRKRITKMCLIQLTDISIVENQFGFEKVGNIEYGNIDFEKDYIEILTSTQL